MDILIAVQGRHDLAGQIYRQLRASIVELLEWAQQRGAVVVEDDYDCEYRFEGRPMGPLKSLDRAGLVAYVGTFSKTIFPELRVGYIVPPASLTGPLCKARQVAATGTVARLRRRRSPRSY
jgi:DNA-binding transcriptional MocR family regulator